MRFLALIFGILLLISMLTYEALADDAAPGFPFQEGEVVTYDHIDKLKDYVPPEFWQNREYFFHEGMEIEVGAIREYGAADAYLSATERFQGQSKIGEDGSLENYTTGQPFANDAIDCKGDPQAGQKIIWNFQKAWDGDGVKATWSYTYWDRGEQLPLYYKGIAKEIKLAHRVEPKYLEENSGDIFKNEKRQKAFGGDVLAPFDARGIIFLEYRYKAEDGPLDQTRNSDMWVYVPDLRRTRRISTAQRTDSIQGTDFTMDDRRSFAGIPPQYDWKCLDEVEVFAPTSTQHLAYPYTEEEYNFGPYGFSFANDRWELRKAWVIRFDPKNDDHPYHHKDIYIDKETYVPFYSFCYDRKEELWKIIWHISRYSEDWNGNDPEAKDGIWYKGWEDVEQPKDLRVVSDIIVNVQTGTGNRIELWNGHCTPLPSKGKIRRFIDIGRLNKGR